MVAERLAKLVQRFGLRVQRFRPRAGEERELVAQIDDAGAKGVQQRRIVARKGAPPAPARLPVGARDGGRDLVPADRAHIPSLDAPHDRGEPRARRVPAERPRRARRAASRSRSIAAISGSGDLGRSLETLEAQRHHVEIARAADLTADRRQRRDRHPRRFADAMEKEPPDRAGLLERLAQLMDLLRRGLARTGTPRRRARRRPGERGAAMLRPAVGAHR